MMKKNCKLWLLLMLVALGMASCTINSDNPASVVDDKEFKADANKDTSVRPGDDFYMYCIGGWWNNPAGRTFAGFVGACIGGLLVAPVITVVKIVRCIIYLIRTSKFIKEDSEALVQMKDYMEYTQVLSENRGISIEELMQRSDMSGNAYAQMVSEHGEAAAEDMMRKCTMTIAANGEIIRKFEA